MSDELILPDGLKVGTGLRVPAQRPLTYAPLTGVIDVVTTGQIADVLDEPTRVPRRTFFTPSVYVKNQGQRGSCNGFAGAKGLERARVLRGLPHVALSGEGLYAQINDGRDEGSMLDDGMQALQATGVPPESMVPAETYLWSRISPEAKAACANFRGFECYRVDTEMDLATALVFNFMCIVAVHVTNAFMKLDNDGVITATDGPGNHAVLVQDLRIHKNEIQFDMVNSWGLSFGDKGHGWISWKRHLRTTSKYHAFYAIRSTNDGTEALGG